MLTTEQLYTQDEMPDWGDISLALYKEFSEKCLFSKTFRYYLENQIVIDVQFKEWAMKHLWSIHHINVSPFSFTPQHSFDKIKLTLVFRVL